MKQYREWSLASLFVCLFFLCGCDSTSMKDVAVSSPEILSFSPESGSIGSEIVVTGEYLDDVVSATIGGGKAVILQKVSNRRLSLKVTNQARSGKIVLVNSIGEGVSEGDFTLEYPAPVVSQAGMPSEVEMGNNLLLSGSSMNVVSAVLFTAEGGTEGNEAEIISQSENEIVVKVPYVESDKAIVTFKYFDGTKEVETSSSSAPKLTVKRYQPEVTTTVFEPANVGDMVVLEGAYLNKIDKVLLGDIECTITLQTETELKFVVPTSDSFKNGDNMVPLKISYFDGRETPTLTDEFIVRVAFVYYWENRTIHAQAGETSAFFSPETGRVYSNDVWSQEVDIIAAAGKNTCKTANIPVVSETDYNSVNPYFFISGSSSKFNLAINSPANSNGQLKNFKTSGKASITGGSSYYGTPALSFAYLDPETNPDCAELVNNVKAGNIKKIDEITFPLDVEKKTCADIKPSVSAAPTTDAWAKDKFEAGVEKTNVTIDAVFLVFYYNVKGYDNKAADKNPVRDVKRIGLMYIKSADFKMKEGTEKDPSASSITFDMYWQKQDYDYSKVQ